MDEANTRRLLQKINGEKVPTNIHLTVNEIIVDQLRMKNIQNIILRKLNYPFFERKRILEILNS